MPESLKNGKEMGDPAFKKLVKAVEGGLSRKDKAVILVAAFLNDPPCRYVDTARSGGLWVNGPKTTQRLQETTRNYQKLQVMP